MKRVLLFILLTAMTATAQMQRYDNFAATTASASGIGNITQVIASATITVFNQPAVGVSCSGGGCVAATTFTSRTGGTPCGGGLPLTRPTSNTCLATADSQGNFGFWAAAGPYQYCVASTNFTTQCFNVILGAPLDGVNGFANIDNVLYVDGVTNATIAAAVTSCGSVNPCVIVVPSTYAGADPASCPSTNITLWDFRSQKFSSNPTHFAINIWDGCPATKWVTENTGGQVRAKHYIGYQPQAASGPGDDTELVYMQTTGSTWPVQGANGNIQESLATVTAVSASTDTITNATTNLPQTIATHEFFATTLGSGSLINDIRASTGAVQSGTGSGQVNSAAVYDAVAMNLPATMHVWSTIGGKLEDPTTGLQTMQLSGTLSATNGQPLVTWVSGDKFVPQAATYPIVIGGVTYILSSCTYGATPTCTLSTNFAAATNTYSYTLAGRAYSGFTVGMQRLDCTEAISFTDPQGNGGCLMDSQSGGTSTQSKFWWRDKSNQQADGTYARMGYYMGTDFGGSQGMIWTSSAGTKLASINNAGTMEIPVVCSSLNTNSCLLFNNGSITLNQALTGTTPQPAGSLIPLVCLTSQKSETAADANVLTCTPPAAAGSYRLRVVLSLSAANAATLGWTATWTDSNGNAQTPANLSLLQSGTAVPALTFTTSAAGNYYGDAQIDVNNSATSIVIKLTFSGTSFTGKLSATIERII